VNRGAGGLIAAAAVLLISSGCSLPSSAVPSPSASPSTAPTLPATRLLYLGQAPAESPQYSFVVANLDGRNKVTRSLGDYPRPNEVRFVQSRNGRYLAWSDHLELRTAASSRLKEAVTIAATTDWLAPLAISEDGDTLAYEVLMEGTHGPGSAKLYLAHVHDKSVKLLRTFSGPFIVCLGQAAFDQTASKLAAVGCGSGMAAGLLVIDASNGTVLSEDDGFRVWPGQAVFGHDLTTVWLIDSGNDSDSIVRYDVGSRSRLVLYRSPGWRQADGSWAPNLAGIFLSPDEGTVAFRGYPPDRIQTIYTIPSSGGSAAVLVREPRVMGIGPWSPDGKYLMVPLAREPTTATQRLLLIDPRTKQQILFDDTGVTLNNFLAWVV
jgi:hypothetical protein